MLGSDLPVHQTAIVGRPGNFGLPQAGLGGWPAGLPIDRVASGGSTEARGVGAVAEWKCRFQRRRIPGIEAA
jgi:hypothetical protein